MAADVRVGTIVRVELQGRRVRGWVVGAGDAERATKPIAKVTGWGPAPELVELASWAAWRWAGRAVSLLRTASPDTAVRGLPPPASPAGGPLAAPDDELVADAFGPASGETCVRWAPAADVMPLVRAASAEPALVLTPSLAEAARLARELRAAGRPVALVPRDWARAAAGGCTVVGARAGAWAPAPGLRRVLVLDEHDEGYAEERAPTWNARDVARERARRAGARCVLVSPIPSFSAAAAGVSTPSRAAERAGWPVFDVVDRRRDDPRTGLYSHRLVNAFKDGRRVVAVLNRKGRARLLACATCGELARCERCGEAVAQTDDGLECAACGQRRPVVCAACGSTKLKRMRAGVTRVREELEGLAGEAVEEVTGDGDNLGTATRVVIGTEAVLHRVDRADVVAFLDFDQELLAPRYRAAEEALALLVRAARLVGGRDGGGRVLVQTRMPHHEVLLAAQRADPGLVLAAELPRRRLLRLPPATALAIVSGEAAEAFVAGLVAVKVAAVQVQGIEVQGPADGRWLVRAPDHAALAAALAAVLRPPGRLRIEVDPVRA
jgi:primosomal protein N' (replication factor Y)